MKKNVNMPKPSSCVLVTLDYPPERGGVARYLGNLVRVSAGRIEVIYVPEEHTCVGPGKVVSARFVWPHWPRWAPLLLFFKRLGRQGSVPLVFISHVLPVGTAAWIASFFGGPHYAILLHGLDLRLAVNSRRKRFLLKCILKRAHAVFTNSGFVAQEVRVVFPTLTPIIVTPGVEPQRLVDREVARARFSISQETIQLLAVTRLVPRKGIDRLIEALAFLPPQIHLVVIGSGTDEGRLRELAHSYGDRIRFETRVEDEERNAWYAASDIFVLPTREERTDVEGFGIVFLEAGLAGLPVIGGHGGGVDEAIIQEETGLLVDPQDPKAIAAAIQRLCDDRVFRARLGSQGRTRAERDFQWQDRWNLIAKTLEL
jgi:phosphatidylinositol alpha-1,6-mannosyltransferase